MEIWFLDFLGGKKMKNVSKNRLLLLAISSGLAGLLGCAAENMDNTDVAAKTATIEKQPEEIKIEILLKDEPKAADSVTEKVETAPASPVLDPNAQSWCQGPMSGPSAMAGLAPYQTTGLASACEYGGYQGFGSIIDPYLPYSPYYVSDVIAFDDDDGHHNHRDDDDDNDI